MKQILPLFFFISLSIAQDKRTIIVAFDDAAREFGVPADVLKGIAFAETRWEQLTWPEGDTASACTGMPRPYGIMSLWDNQYFGHSLNLAAGLIGKDPSELKSDLVQNIRGAAALLKKYHNELPLPEGTNAGDIESWRNAIAAYSGLPQVDFAQQHALDIYSQMTVGYHKYHIDWNARPVNIGPTRLAVSKIVAEAQAKKLYKGESVTNQPDYPLAKWASAYPGHWYTSGSTRNFVVIHDMEGYYLSTIAYFQMATTQASIYYCVNGLQNGSGENNPNDAPAGEITQMVEEKYWAWHVVCWNPYMFGIEHEGFVSNPAWYTDQMYRSSAQLTAYLCRKYNITEDRDHIIAHGEWQNSGWTSWMAVNYPSIDVTCNNHTDPGPYWNWNYYMTLVRGDTLPPKVTSVIPNVNAVGVKAYKPVILNFSSSMDTASVDQAFSITPRVSGSLAWSPDFQTMTFKPASFLSFNAVYTVKIDSTAKNQAFGYELDGNGDGVGGDPFQFSFTIEPPDTTPPVVVRSYPQNNSLGVPVLAEPIITMNKPLQTSSLVSHIILTDADSVNVSLIGVNVDSLNDRGIITFQSTGLRQNSSYTIKVLPGLKDLYGNTMTSSFTIHFSTAPTVVIQGLVFDGFETNARSWIQPNINTATVGDDSNQTLFSFSSEKIKNGTLAGKLAYRFSGLQAGVITLQAAASPVLDAYSSFGMWVWGDLSDNGIEFLFQPQSQRFVVDSIDWRGWKFINAPINTLSGSSKQFSSIIVRQRVASSTSGVLYFDDMQVNSVVNSAQVPPMNVPTRFALAQNYPNPFNPSTIIHYQIPKESRVRLTVYNLLGQAVRVLVDENEGPGFYSRTFDASALPSGVYFYRLQSLGFQDVQKMLLLR